MEIHFNNQNNFIKNNYIQRRHNIKNSKPQSKLKLCRKLINCNEICILKNVPSILYTKQLKLRDFTGGKRHDHRPLNKVYGHDSFPDT